MIKDIRIVFHAIKIMYRYRRRTILSILGISFSVVVFIFIQLSFSIQNDIQYASELSFPKNEILLYISENDFENTYLKRNRYTKHVLSNSLNVQINDSNININIVLSGVSEDFLDFSLPSINDIGILENSKLLYGRGFNQNDIVLQKKVLIITEKTCQLFFSGDSCLNEYIQLYESDGTPHSFQIIGIISDTPSTYMEINSLGKNKNNIDISMYVPYSIIKENSNPDKNIIIIRSENVESEVEYILQNTTISTENLYTYFLHQARVQEFKESTNNTSYIIILVIMLFSSLNMMIITLFVVKERIPEIGIKKAIGATDNDILFQLYFESLISGIIPALIGMLFSIFLNYLIRTYYSIYLGQNILNIEYNLLFLNFIIVLFFVVVFSFVPAYFGSKQNILKSIRYE